MNPILLRNWETVESLYEDFECTRWGTNAAQFIEGKDDIEIILGYYSYQDYSGEAFVLLRRKSNGILYEVNGSHCSCYGLEGQWSPEEADVEVLRHRLVNGRLGRSYDGWNKYADELSAILDSLGVPTP
ncbi:hypothetical protein LOZ80_15125 [Paenibacillus sp. HWE-109]|uniref:hypothetical protein n=1 Tax=Paenibacillus sp. HWE-109 TaxID=1306526 RepID=UPI001EDE376A|nr:hypothetical protein [Paenibacillus sp. HWE-109]UKS30192.1 hypothetical protein LOZ80_15125 [Paenibacillus sp. HWE-109]